MPFHINRCVVMIGYLLFGIGIHTAIAASPVTLEESFRAALKRNEEILQGKERDAQADLKVAQARSLIFPKIRFQGGLLFQPEPADPTARAFSPAQQTTALLNASQPLIRLSEVFGFSRVRHQRTRAQLLNQQAQRVMFLNVATQFYEILKLEKDIENLRELIRIYEDRNTDLTRRVSRGESQESELVSSQAIESGLRAELSLVESNIRGARQMFSVVTGLSPESPVKDPQVRAQLGPIAQYTQGISERPDVKAASELLDAQREGVSEAWAAHAPTLDVGANYYLTRPGFLSELKWDVGLTLVVPIFEGGRTHARVEEAISERKDAELELAKVRKRALAEVHELYDHVRARDTYLGHLKKSLDLNQRSVKLFQKNYRRGLTRNLDVQMAIREFQTAQRSYDQAYFTSQLEYFRLLTAAASLPPQYKDSL